MRPAMRLAALLPLAGLAAACAHGPARAAGGGEVAAYFPLAVGDVRVWEDRSPQLPAGEAPPLRTVRIVSRTADGFFRDGERGELRMDGDCLRGRVRRLLCGPLVKGHAWSSVVSASSTERYEIVGTGERVATAAGTFDDCVRVRSIDRAGGAELVAEISYAPGVGPVRIETFAVVGGEVRPQLRATLRSYRLEGR